MALSVRALAAQRDLGVRVLAGAGGGEQPITWVHVSELDDPTPFLSGGELLLTTGLFVRPETDFDAYVERLGVAGVLGLGFGVGLSCDEVPAELVAAAVRHALPLLEVPRRTPFIALSRAVSRALAADEYAAVTRTFTAQQELTRAALAPDSPARLIRLLARKVDGWVALLDGRGGVVALDGDRAAAMVPAVAVEVARLREHRG
jgi:purine catabolism regulator